MPNRLVFGLTLCYTTSTLRPTRPRLKHRRLYFDYLVLSDNHCCIGIFLLAVLCTVIVIEPFSVGAQMQRHGRSSILCVRYWQHRSCLRPRCVAGFGKPDNRLGLGGSTTSSLTSSSTRRRLRLQRFLLCAQSYAASLRLRHRVWLISLDYLGNFIDHGYFERDIINHDYKSSSRLPGHRHKSLPLWLIYCRGC